MTRPKFDGLKTCWRRHRTTYFERSATPAVATKIHQPSMLHQSPCTALGRRRTKATPLPVSSALAGQKNDTLKDERDRDLENRRGADGEKDLRDRHLEVEADLTDHLKRGDDRREV